jgi:bifunctional DNA-binding transcriptional regulator/antitoxin component of YhaV-PrlF toxin-antitoxin module
MQTCIVKVRKDGLLAPPKKVREQLRQRVGDDLEIVMRPRRTKTPLEEVREKLSDLVGPEEAQRWLHAPLALFKGRRPVDLIKQGEGDRIMQIIVRLEDGIHN